MLDLLISTLLQAAIWLFMAGFFVIFIGARAGWWMHRQLTKPKHDFPQQPVVLPEPTLHDRIMAQHIYYSDEPIVPNEPLPQIHIKTTEVTEEEIERVIHEPNKVTLERIRKTVIKKPHL